jgi:hypothetical protein
MTLVRRLSAVVALVGLSLGCMTGAHAQASRTWVSGVGDDANPCSRTAPCKTFAGAISKTAAFGEIDCLDPGGFGAVSITKSMTIDCAGGMSGQAGGILSAGTTGILINFSAPGANDRVIVRNLVISGFNTGTYGIRLLNAPSVTIEHVMVTGVGTGSLPAIDLRTTSVGKVYMRDVEIQNVTGSGIHVSNASVTLDNVFVSGVGGSGLQVGDNAVVNVMNSRFVGSAVKGVFVVATSPSDVNLENTLIARSTFEGIFANQAGVTVRLSNCSIFNNGIAVQANNSAMVMSYGNNRIAGNPSPGTSGSMVPAMEQ